MSDNAIYLSECQAKNLWQRYEIFEDRLELHTLFGNVKIPFEHVEQVLILPAVLTSLRLHLKNFRLGMKLDVADLNEHLVLNKDTGLFHQVLFTPSNPPEFKRVLDGALERFREKARKA